MNIHLIIKPLPLLKTNHVKAVVSAIAAKAIPVVVLLAMSPVNATPQEALAQLSEKNSVTMYSQLPQIEAPNALEVAQNPKKPKINPPPRKANGELLVPIISDPGVYVNSEKFRGLDGKNYYLYYIDWDNRSSSGKYAISDIFIVPEDYEPAFTTKNCVPPHIYGFVNHNNEFIGIATYESSGENFGFLKEIRLPDEINEKILKIVTNKNPAYEFFNKHRYGQSITSYYTNSLELRIGIPYTDNDLWE